MNLGNPIRTIKNLRTGTSYNFNNVPCELTIGRYDVSTAQAGRDEAGRMHKEMMGKSVKLNVKFKNIPTDIARTVCRLAEINEYINVTYVDIVEGDPSDNFLVTREFYVGDRTLTLYNAAIDVWSELSFAFIERGIH